MSNEADTTPVELDALGRHVARCQGSRGRWFALGAIADSVRDFLAPRLVTVGVVVGVLAAVASLLA